MKTNMMAFVEKQLSLTEVTDVKWPELNKHIEGEGGGWLAKAKDLLDAGEPGASITLLKPDTVIKGTTTVVTKPITMNVNKYIKTKSDNKFSIYNIHNNSFGKTHNRTFAHSHIHTRKVMRAESH